MSSRSDRHNESRKVLAVGRSEGTPLERTLAAHEQHLKILGERIDLVNERIDRIVRDYL